MRVVIDSKVFINALLSSPSPLARVLHPSPPGYAEILLGSSHTLLIYMRILGRLPEYGFDEVGKMLLHFAEPSFAGFPAFRSPFNIIYFGVELFVFFFAAIPQCFCQLQLFSCLIEQLLQGLIVLL